MKPLRGARHFRSVERRRPDGLPRIPHELMKRTRHGNNARTRCGRCRAAGVRPGTCLPPPTAMEVGSGTQCRSQPASSTISYPIVPSSPTGKPAIDNGAKAVRQPVDELRSYSPLSMPAHWMPDGLWCPDASASEASYRLQTCWNEGCCTSPGWASSSDRARWRCWSSRGGVVGPRSSETATARRSYIEIECRLTHG